MIHCGIISSVNSKASNNVDNIYQRKQSFNGKINQIFGEITLSLHSRSYFLISVGSLIILCINESKSMLALLAYSKIRHLVSSAFRHQGNLVFMRP